MRPLVSVLMPCYNSARTLPMALASLLAQTYQNWECILVDDGSTDHPDKIAAATNDPRIRYFRIEQNVGSGAARQVALDNAKGDLVAWLDADDWYYPEKLRLQVEVMERERSVAILSGGLAIVDRSDVLAGIRCHTAGKAPAALAPIVRPAMPPFAFASSMVRLRSAKEAGFDSSFHRSQDVDFLLRILLREPHMLLPHVVYVYTEFQTASQEKVREDYRFVRRMFWKQWAEFPYSCSLEIAKSLFKSVVYCSAFTCGFEDHVIRRRSKIPRHQHLVEFQMARSIVAEKAHLVFGEGRRFDGIPH